MTCKYLRVIKIKKRAKSKAADWKLESRCGLPVKVHTLYNSGQLQNVVNLCVTPLSASSTVSV